MTTLAQEKRKFKKKIGKKKYDEIQKRWDIKMIHPVSAFVFGIMKHVNPKLKKHLKKDEYLINGPEIEGELWTLLTKLRQITLREKRK